MWLRSLQGERDARLAKETAAATMVQPTDYDHSCPASDRPPLTHSLDSQIGLIDFWPSLDFSDNGSSEAGPADVAVLTMIMMPCD